ncbi:MAG: hypothetical protein AAFP84_07230 [Actinomycetota bacterium]
MHVVRRCIVGRHVAELGVTIETIDQLYLGPLGNDDDFFERVTSCVARFD